MKSPNTNPKTLTTNPYTLNLFVSKYKIVLPTIKELEELVKEDLEELNK